MALPWTSLQLDSSRHITIPSTFGGQSIATTLRTTKGNELTYLEGDASFIDIGTRLFTLIPESGTEDSLVQINGGHSGTIIKLRPDDPSYVITIEGGPNLFLPLGPITLSEVWHSVELVCFGTDMYLKDLQ